MHTGPRICSIYIYIFVWELPRLPIELQWLKGAKPDFALKQTAHYFMDLLSPEEHTTLKEICNVWNSAAKPFTVGTTCSGLETGGLVVEKTFEALNERFGISLQSKVAFAVELHEVLWLKNNNHSGIVQPFSMDKFYVRSFQLLLRLRQLCPEPLTAGFRIDLKNQKVSCPFFVPKKSDYICGINPDVKEKRNFIQRAHAGKIDHLFADVRDVAKGTAHCYIHGCDCAIPRVDMIISGTACTSISGERSSNSEFATCSLLGWELLG